MPYLRLTLWLLLALCCVHAAWAWCCDNAAAIDAERAAYRRGFRAGQMDAAERFCRGPLPEPTP